MDKDYFKFACYTDTHLMGINPSGRKDDYSKSILKKIEDVYLKAEEEKVDFIVFMGDLFNSFRIYSYDVISEFINILSRFGKKTYFIVGQHDLYGYNKDHYEKSALKFVSDRSDGLFILVDGVLSLSQCDIHSCHVYDEVSDVLKNIPDNDKFKMVLVHDLLTTGKENFDIVDINKLPKSNADLVLSGDLHSGYELTESNGTTYYNPGAVSRIKNNTINKNRTIKCGVFTVSKFFNKYNIVFDEYVLPSAKPSIEVFRFNTEEDKLDLKNNSANDFISKLEDFVTESVDIFDLLNMIKKEEDVDGEIVDFVMQYRRRLNNEFDKDNEKEQEIINK